MLLAGTRYSIQSQRQFHGRPVVEEYLDWRESRATFGRTSSRFHHVFNRPREREFASRLLQGNCDDHSRSQRDVVTTLPFELI
jgi:hypothetical protein